MFGQTNLRDTFNKPYVEVDDVVVFFGIFFLEFKAETVHV